MTLTTHAIVGAAVASFVPSNPVLGLSLAFLSHLAIDVIPHWDYAIKSDFVRPRIGGKFIINKHLILDIVRIGGDAKGVHGGVVITEVCPAGCQSIPVGNARIGLLQQRQTLAAPAD